MRELDISDKMMRPDRIYQCTIVDDLCVLEEFGEGLVIFARGMCEGVFRGLESICQQKASASDLRNV